MLLPQELESLKLVIHHAVIGYEHSVILDCFSSSQREQKYSSFHHIFPLVVVGQHHCKAPVVLGILENVFLPLHLLFCLLQTLFS